ncbi:hypothetical protein L9F63_021749, partial [Diploptera punctata]
ELEQTAMPWSRFSGCRPWSFSGCRPWSPGVAVVAVVAVVVRLVVPRRFARDCAVVAVVVRLVVPRQDFRAVGRGRRGREACSSPTFHFRAVGRGREACSSPTFRRGREACSSPTFQDFRAVGRGREACSSPTFRRGREACSSPTFRQRLRLASSRVVYVNTLKRLLCIDRGSMNLRAP